MKRRTKILIGIGVLGGLVGANLWYRKSKATKAAEVDELPDVITTPTTDAPANTSPANTSTAKKTTDSRWRSFKALNDFPATFRNRVYTKVKDFHGVEMAKWETAKTMGLYQRIAMKLEAKGIALETAALGQIGPVLKEIGAEGFPFGTPRLTPRERIALIGLGGRRRSNEDREDWA